MAEGPLIVDIDGNTAPLDAKMAKSDKALNELVKKEAKIRRELNRKIAGTLSSVRSMVSLARAGVAVIGITLDPIQEAIVVAIQTSMTAALAIHRTLETGTFGISAAATVGLSLIVVTASLAAIAQATAGMNNARAQTDRAVSFLLQMESTLAMQQIWT